MRVIVRMLATTYGLSVSSTPICAIGLPIGPIENGTTYIVRPRIDPSNSASSVARICSGSRQLFVGPASSSRALQMNVRSSTRATSDGSERARKLPGRLPGSSGISMPDTTICAHRSRYSSSLPSHQTMRSGLASAAISRTQPMSLGCRTYAGAATEAASDRSDSGWFISVTSGSGARVALLWTRDCTRSCARMTPRAAIGIDVKRSSGQTNADVRHAASRLRAWPFPLLTHSPLPHMTDSSRRPATLIPGDGIGPEIVDATRSVLDALDAPFDWDVQQAGMAAATTSGEPLPRATLDSIRRTGLALKGPLATPVGGGFRSINVRLREEFKLFANVRPARTLVAGRYDDIDIVLVRENLEGLYVAFEHYIPIDDDAHAVAISSGVNTRAGSRRIAQFAFDYALRNGRKKVTIIHKANVLKALTGIFLETAREVAMQYEGRVAVDDRIVDACAMQLVLNPWQFDVLLCTNLFGDILSDEIAGLVGGLGLAPGANIGEDAAIFEAVHGSAPDIAGKGVANPLALMYSSALMLEHVERQDLAARLRGAIHATVHDDNVRTKDLGGAASTGDFAAAIARRIAS